MAKGQSIIPCDSKFPGGNGSHFTESGEKEILFDVDLHGGEKGLWFHFRVANAHGPIRFILRNAYELLEWPRFEHFYPVFTRPVGGGEPMSQPKFCVQQDRLSLSCHAVGKRGSHSATRIPSKT